MGASRFGAAVAVAGDGKVVIGEPTTRKSYIFSSVGGMWTQTDVLDGTLASSFGEAVAVSDHTVVVGAPLADTAVGRSGAAVVFSVT